MMSYPTSHYASDPESSENYSDYETAEEAWRAARRRRTYLPAVFFALVIGALIGALLSRRERAPQKDAVQAAKEWLETAYAQLSEKLPQLAEKVPQLAEKIPHPKTASVQRAQQAFLEQAHQVGKKLKWW